MTSSLLAQTPTWIAQRRVAGQVDYYGIRDPFEMQHLLNDVLKIHAYGYVKYISNELNPIAEPWFPEEEEDHNNCNGEGKSTKHRKTLDAQQRNEIKQQQK